MITRRLLEDEDLLFLKRPEARSASDDPAVAQRVSEMLLELQRDGEDALRRYARDLDGWERDDIELTRAENDGAEIDPDLRPFEEQQDLVFAQAPRDHGWKVSQRAVRHNPGLPSLSTG